MGSAARAAPEIQKRAVTATREADVFAFGMVVMEVCPRALPLTPRVEGWVVQLTSEYCLRFLQEAIDPVGSQPQSLPQTLWVATGRLARRRHKDLV